MGEGRRTVTGFFTTAPEGAWKLLQPTIYVRWSGTRMSKWHRAGQIRDGLVSIDCAQVKRPVALLFTQRSEVKPVNDCCRYCAR